MTYRIILWMAILTIVCNCQPTKNGTTQNSDEQNKNGLTTSDKIKIARIVAPICTGILGIIGTCLIVLFLYKKAFPVAKTLIDAHSNVYNVSVGYLKNVYCWSLNVFCSSCTCFCQRPFCWCCRGKLSSCCRGDAEENQHLVVYPPLDRIVKTEDENNCPRHFQNYYGNIMNKSCEIEFHEALQDHQKYMDTKSRMSHKVHCKNEDCMKNNHRDFEVVKGLQLKPFIYHLIFDWADLRNRSYKDITSEFENPSYITDILQKELESLFRYKDELNYKLAKGDLPEILKRGKNVLITLLNFPSVEEAMQININSNEGRLLFLVTNFYWWLKICVANVVKSSWKLGAVSKADDGIKKCDLYAYSRDLKTFPDGIEITDLTDLKNRLRLFAVFRGNEDRRLVNNNLVEVVQIPETNDSKKKVHISVTSLPANTTKLYCRIYLGNFDGQIESNGVIEYKYKKPILESPLVIFPDSSSENEEKDEYGTPETSGRASGTSGGTPGTSGGVHSTSGGVPGTSAGTPKTSEESGKAPEFKFDDSDGAKILNSQLLGSAKYVQILGGILDRNSNWHRVATNVFANMEHVLENELVDIENSRSGCGMEFLKNLGTRQAGVHLKWAEFCVMCEKNHGWFDIRTAFTDEENTRLNDTKLSKFNLNDKQKVARKLDTLRRWWVLATEEYNFEQHVVTSIDKKGIQKEDHHLPTESLLTLVWERLPDYTLREFAKACSDAGLDNAVNKLKEFGKKHVKPNQQGETSF